MEKLTTQPSEQVKEKYKKTLEGPERVDRQVYDRDLVRKLYICGFNAGDIARSGVRGIDGMSRMNVYITLYRDGTFDKHKDTHLANRKKMLGLMRDLAISYMLDLGLNADLVEG